MELAASPHQHIPCSADEANNIGVEHADTRFFYDLDGNGWKS